MRSKSTKRQSSFHREPEIELVELTPELQKQVDHLAEIIRMKFKGKKLPSLREQLNTIQ